MGGSGLEVKRLILLFQVLKACEGVNDNIPGGLGQ